MAKSTEVRTSHNVRLDTAIWKRLKTYSDKNYGAPALRLLNQIVGEWLDKNEKKEKR